MRTALVGGPRFGGSSRFADETLQYLVGRKLVPASTPAYSARSAMQGVALRNAIKRAAVLGCKQLVICGDLFAGAVVPAEAITEARRAVKTCFDHGIAVRVATSASELRDVGASFGVDFAGAAAGLDVGLVARTATIDRVMVTSPCSSTELVELLEAGQPDADLIASAVAVDLTDPSSALELAAALVGANGPSVLALAGPVHGVLDGGMVSIVVPGPLAPSGFHRPDLGRMVVVDSGGDVSTETVPGPRFAVGETADELLAVVAREPDCHHYLCVRAPVATRLDVVARLEAARRPNVVAVTSVEAPALGEAAAADFMHYARGWLNATEADDAQRARVEAALEQTLKDLGVRA